MKRYYLAYGSNLNIGQMRYRCPGARVLGTAVIPDYQLLFRGSKTGSYLTIEPKEGASVPVAVWEVDDANERRLDAYEGYPTFYYKVTMSITFEGIETGRLRTREAFVYIMREDRPLGIPSNEYLLTCLEGYDAFDFDPTLLMEAYLRSKEGVESHEGA